MGTSDTTDSSVGSDESAQVCNLPSEALAERRAMIKAEIAPYVRRTEELPNGLAWEFDQNPAMRARLEQLIELERRCCGGLEWSLQGLRGADTIRLVVEGIDPRSELFVSFRSPS